MREFENLLADHDAHADALLARYEDEVEKAERDAEWREVIQAGLDADSEREAAWWNDDLERDYTGPLYDHDLETDPDYWEGRR
jgi:hypothetical protein